MGVTHVQQWTIYGLIRRDEKLKLQVYKSIIRPVIFCDSETRSVFK